jgi:diacylglycerol kinase family enzyme
LTSKSIASSSFNVSVGVSPRMMKDTDSTEKKRFGPLAYIWTMLTRVSIFQVHRYDLTIDGKRREMRAVEILASSTTLLKKPPFVFGPPETLSDGQCEVYVITEKSTGIRRAAVEYRPRIK